MMQFARSVFLSLALAGFGFAAAMPAVVHATKHTASADMMAEGEVRKIDKDAGKITLKHGEIRNLEMPPMTMVFQVSDKAMLDKVKAGDRVRFAAEKLGGQLTVTAIEPGR